MAQQHIGPELFAFFRDLKLNNDRDWFKQNRHRYEAHVQDPLLQFIREFDFRLRAISPEFVADARKSGGSLFRKDYVVFRNLSDDEVQRSGFIDAFASDCSLGAPFLRFLADTLGLAW